MFNTLPDPFKVAEAIIKACPDNEPWQEETHASYQEFMQAVHQVLQGGAKQDTLFARKFEMHRLSTAVEPLAYAGNIFDEKKKTVDLKKLSHWAEYWAKHGAKPREAIPAIAFEAPPEDAQLSPKGDPFGNRPASNMVYKFAPFNQKLDRQHEPFIMQLVETAIERAMDKHEASRPAWIFGVHIQLKPGEIEYMSMARDGNVANIPDFKSQALLELQKLKRQFAEQFERQKKGYVMAVSAKPKAKEPADELGIMVLGRGLDTSRDFSPLINAFLVFLEGRDQKHPHRTYSLNGRDVAPDDIQAAAALNNAIKQEKRMQDQDTPPDVLNKMVDAGMIALPGQFRQVLGKDYPRLEALAKELADGNVAEFVEITSRGEVKWLEQSLGLGRGH